MQLRGAFRGFEHLAKKTSGKLSHITSGLQGAADGGGVLPKAGLAHSRMIHRSRRCSVRKREAPRTAVVRALRLGSLPISAVKRAAVQLKVNCCTLTCGSLEGRPWRVNAPGPLCTRWGERVAPRRSWKASRPGGPGRYPPACALHRKGLLAFPTTLTGVPSPERAGGSGQAGVPAQPPAGPFGPGPVQPSPPLAPRRLRACGPMGRRPLRWGRARGGVALPHPSRVVIVPGHTITSERRVPGPRGHPPRAWDDPDRRPCR